MKVLLTQPIVELMELPPCLPDLGLGYIASALSGKHNVHILDWNMDGGVSGFNTQLHNFTPDLCGIKVFTKDVAAAIETIGIIRRALPDCLIILGGPHASCAEPNEIFSLFSDIDYAFRGEVEHTLPLFLDKLEKKLDVSKIPGLIWRKNGTVYCNTSTFSEKLDDLNDPAWEIIDPRKYGQEVKVPIGDTTRAPIITTRGCPGNCTFCSAWRVNGKRVRKRIPLRVVEEMELLYHDYDVRMFHIMDNCFTSDAEHFVEICRELINRKTPFKWDCNSFERLDNLRQDHLELMYRAGCRMLQMGIESASEITRRSINKHADFPAYKRVIKEARNVGMQVTAWFILGFPGESKKEMRETVRRAFELPADELMFTQCYPIPGSAVYSQWKRQYNLKEFDWAGYSVATSPYPLSKLNSKELLRLMRLARLGVKIRRHSRVLGNLWARLVV